MSICVCMYVLLLLLLLLLLTRRMAIANWTGVSWVAYAPGTIAVNVTRIEREFNACQTPRSFMYPSIFNHLWNIALLLLLTRRMAIANWTGVSWVAYAPGTIAVNVTRIEREFNACQTPRSFMYPSIFNHLWNIAVADPGGGGGWPP